MKITKIGDCPKEETFDPSTAPDGTLMRNCHGCLCVRTGEKWGESGCEVYLFEEGGTCIGCAACQPYTRVPTGEKYLLEQE